MRPHLLQWLVCPLCHRELTPVVAVSERRPLAEVDYHVLKATAPIEDPNDIEIDVISGALACDACRTYYPIYNGIPRMLIYPTRVVQLHAQENCAWLTTHLAGFDLPQRIPPPGEQEVLRNFSTEWVGYKWTGASYWSLTPDTMLRCIRYALGLGPCRDLQHRLVLEVGIGIGGSSDLCMTLAKKATTRPLGSKNPDPQMAALEDELFEAINQTGIGPQGLGGATTALAVQIESAWTHITCNPVAVNLQCWRAERRRAKVWPDGRVEVGF